MTKTGTTLDIFKQTTRPGTKLFYKSHDGNDRKFGDAVSSNAQSYDKSKFVIVGCPQDEGVKRNKGRVGAAKAPGKIREMFYRLSVPSNLKDGVLFDLGNTIIGRTLEQTHDTHENIVSQLLCDGKKVISLGGGNDISYPDCKALSLISKSVLAFNIDSHFDVRDNKPRNSGTPYRQLLEGKHLVPSNFHELAIQPFANSENYFNYLKKRGVRIHTLERLRLSGIGKTIKRILDSNKLSAIFWGFDMDSVRSADAPGVSASYPTGLTSEEILKIASIAGLEKKSRVFEISEVNPKYDLDNRTCKLAALLILEFLKSGK